MNATPAALFEFWRLWTALVMTSRADVREQRVDRVLPCQADERQQHEQGGEEGEDPVIGQRCGEQREVVLLELLDGAPERALPGGLREIGGGLRRAAVARVGGSGFGHVDALPSRLISNA